MKAKKGEPILTRGDLAVILNVAPLTIRNRERRQQYPEPTRDLNGYRTYTLNDILNLQLITYSRIDTRPIMSLLYEKGYHDTKELGRLIDAALARRKPTSS